MENKINKNKTIINTTVSVDISINIRDIVDGIHNKEDAENLIKALQEDWKGSLNVTDPVCYSEGQFQASVDKIRNNYFMLSNDQVEIINKIAGEI